MVDYDGLSVVFLLFLANAHGLQYMKLEIKEAEIDATIVMQCRIEKKNYPFRPGFTLNHPATGEDLPFLLDSLDRRRAHASEELQRED